MDPEKLGSVVIFATESGEAALNTVPKNGGNISVACSASVKTPLARVPTCRNDPRPNLRIAE